MVWCKFYKIFKGKEVPSCVKFNKKILLRGKKHLVVSIDTWREPHEMVWLARNITASLTTISSWNGKPVFPTFYSSFFILRCVILPNLKNRHFFIYLCLKNIIYLYVIRAWRSEECVESSINQLLEKVAPIRFFRQIQCLTAANFNAISQFDLITSCISPDHEVPFCYLFT